MKNNPQKKTGYLVNTYTQVDCMGVGILPDLIKKYYHKMTKMSIPSLSCPRSVLVQGRTFTNQK